MNKSSIYQAGVMINKDIFADRRSTQTGQSVSNGSIDSEDQAKHTQSPVAEDRRSCKQSFRANEWYLNVQYAKDFTQIKT